MVANSDNNNHSEAYRLDYTSLPLTPTNYNNCNPRTTTTTTDQYTNLIFNNNNNHLNQGQPQNLLPTPTNASNCYKRSNSLTNFLSFNQEDQQGIKDSDKKNNRAKQIIASFQMGEFFEELKDEFLPNRTAAPSGGGARSVNRVMEYNPQEDEGFSVMSVTIRPKKYWDMGMLIAVVYSYVPHVMVPVFLWRIWYLADVFSVEGLVLLSLVACVNDFGVKRIYKQVRPVTSRAHGYGMPSSHCACSWATMLWGIYEIWIGEAGTLISRDIIPTDFPDIAYEILAPLPLWPALYHTFLIVFIFFPMPWARVKVGDHTVKQSAVGCLVGLLVGAFYCFAILEGGAEWWLTREWYRKLMTTFTSSAIAATGAAVPAAVPSV